MFPIETLTTFLMASVLLGLAPGPDNIFVLTQSALRGKIAGLWACKSMVPTIRIVNADVEYLFANGKQS